MPSPTGFARDSTTVVTSVSEGVFDWHGDPDFRCSSEREPVPSAHCFDFVYVHVREGGCTVLRAFSGFVGDHLPAVTWYDSVFVEWDAVEEIVQPDMPVGEGQWFYSQRSRLLPTSIELPIH